jgi:hypothetical protein
MEEEMHRVLTILAAIGAAVTLTALPAAAQSTATTNHEISATSTQTALQKDLAAREQVLIQAFDGQNTKLFGDLVNSDAIAISPHGVMPSTIEERQMQHMRMHTSTSATCMSVRLLQTSRLSTTGRR